MRTQGDTIFRVLPSMRLFALLLGLAGVLLLVGAVYVYVLGTLGYLLPFVMSALGFVAFLIGLVVKVIEASLHTRPANKHMSSDEE